MEQKAEIQNDHVHVKNNYLFATYGQTITRGWESVPNLLLDYGHKIDLTDSQTMFIIQVGRAIQRNKKKEATTKAFVKDTDIMMSCSDKTLSRIRTSLSKLKDDKGNQLIDFKTYYNRVDKKIVSSGTIYNFSRLFDYLFEKFGEVNYNDFTSSNISNNTEKPVNSNIKLVSSNEKAPEQTTIHNVPETDNMSNDTQTMDKLATPKDKLSDTINKNIRSLRIYKTDTVFKKLILMSNLNPDDQIPYQVGLIDNLLQGNNHWILEGNVLDINLEFPESVTKQYFKQFIDKIGLYNTISMNFNKI